MHQKFFETNLLRNFWQMHLGISLENASRSSSELPWRIPLRTPLVMSSGISSFIFWIPPKMHLGVLAFGIPPQILPVIPSGTLSRVRPRICPNISPGISLETPSRFFFQGFLSGLLPGFVQGFLPRFLQEDFLTKFLLNVVKLSLVSLNSKHC